MSSTSNGAILEHPTGAILAAYSHGQLDDAELVSVDAHLAECEECRLVVEGVVPDTLLTLLRFAATDVDDPPFPKPAASKSTIIVPPQELLAHPRYKIGDLLGIGGMGAVYKAEHLLMERPVALKVLDRKLTDNPATTDRFRREVRAAARLTHPHIVAAFDAEQAGDVHFLVMEFVDGVSLARRLSERGPLPVEEACDFIRQAALGLQHAHERGMVHRDIKPQNLMLTPAGQVKILDFGLARFVMECVPGDANISLEEEPLAFGKESMAIRLTHTGLVMGTPDYIAPEQARDSHLADIRADIYSLGCTLYELLAGQSPFPEGKAVDKVRGHLSRTPQPLDQLRRDVPPELLRIVERMMAKEPANRFQTPADVAAALTPFTAAPPPPRKRWWPAIAACLGLIAFLLAGAVIYIQTDNGRIVVETDDDKIAVMIQKAGGVKIVDQANGREYHLRPGEQAVRSGEYLIDVSEPLAGLEFQTKRFELKRGKEVRLTAKYEASREGGGQLPTDNPQTESDSGEDGLYQGKPAAYWQKQLRDGDPTYREEAIKALAGIARRNKSLIPIIIAVLGDEKVTTTPKVLADLGIDALPALIGVLTTKPSPRAAQDAALAIARMGPAAKAAIPSLLSAAQSDDDRISGAAIYALGQVRADAAVALPVIADALGYRLKSGIRISNVALTVGNFDGSRTSFGRNLFSAVNKLDREIGSFISEKFPDDGRSTVKPLDDKELAHRWRLIHESLKKEYPVAAPFVPAFAPATAVDEGTYQGKPTQHWLKQIEDGDPDYRAEAVKALGSIAQKNHKLIPTIAAVAIDRNNHACHIAADVLIQLGEAAAPTILQILDGDDESARSHICTALNDPGNLQIGFGRGSLPVLLGALKNREDTIREAGVKALFRHREKAKVALPLLVEVLGQTLDKLEASIAKGTPIPLNSIGLPYYVLDAIVAIDPGTSKTVPKDVLKIPEGTADELKAIVPKWRKAHQTLVSQFPSPPTAHTAPAAPTEPDGIKSKSDALPDRGPLYLGKSSTFWCKQYQDAAPKFRLEAIEALGNLAVKDKSLIPAVVAGLNDSDLEVGQKASSMLKNIGPDALPAILTGVDRKSTVAVRHAADTILWYFAKGKDATPLLIDALKMDDWSTRRAAVAALLRVGPDAKSALPALVDLMGVSLATKEIAENIEGVARMLAEKKGPIAKSGSGRAMPIEILEAILVIDPGVKEALPEGMLDAGKIRTSSGINLAAPMSLWKQTHEALKKRYPASADPKVGPAKGTSNKSVNDPNRRAIANIAPGLPGVTGVGFELKMLVTTRLPAVNGGLYDSSATIIGRAFAGRPWRVVATNRFDANSIGRRDDEPWIDSAGRHLPSAGARYSVADNRNPAMSRAASAGRFAVRFA